MNKWVEELFALPTWLAVVAIFSFPAAEASVFLGFVIPGEIVVILGGVLAYRSKIELWIVLIAAITGAIVGDSVGYGIGRRWGRRVLNSTLGRFIKSDHIDKTERFISQRGARAVFLGRWTAALRALVPGMTGMARVPYSKFLFWNVIGGSLWATTFVLLGYLAGNSYREVERRANIAGWLALVIIAVVSSGAYLFVHRHRQVSDG